MLVTSNFIACNKQFLLSHSVFFPFGEILQFYEIHNCRLQTLLVWMSLKFVLILDFSISKAFA